MALASAVGLAERGDDVRLFSAVGPISEEIAASPVKVTLLDQPPVIDDPHRWSAALRGIWNRHAYHSLRELLNQCDPNRTVVHFHVWVKSLSASVIRAALDSGFKTVVTAHDFFLACPNGGFYDYRRQLICPLRAMSAACVLTNCDKRSYAQKLWRVARHAVQRGKGRMPVGLKHFVTLSDLSERILKPYLPGGAVLHRVPNPIFVTKEDPVDVAHNDAFVFVGRFDPEKGALLFAEAATQARAGCVFVGDGSEAEAVRRIAPHAQITGWLDREGVRRNLRQARALVFPSRWQETFGLTVAEAAASGIPAVVADTSAAAELVEHGKTGLVFDGGRLPALVEAIETIQKATTAAELGQAAYRRYWDTPYTLERHLDALHGVYEAVRRV